MTGIPRDPVMLLSYINTQLRDFIPASKSFAAPFPWIGKPWMRPFRPLIIFTTGIRTSICKARLSAYPAAFSATLFLWKTE